MNKKYSSTCRICLNYGRKVKKPCKSLFEVHNNEIILNNVTSIANVKIQENDGLPNKICANCLAELDAAINFKDKCERSNKFLSENKIEQTNIEPKCSISPIPILDEKFKQEFKTADNHYEETEYLDVEFLETITETQDEDTKVQVIPELKVEVEETTHNQKSSKSQLSNVKKSRAIDLKLICHDCGGSFKSKCKLRVHWKKVHKSENLICNFCKRTFRNFRGYNVHMKKRPQNCYLATRTRIEGVGRSRIFHCTYCSFQSKRPKDFGNHLNIHTGDRPYRCKLCPRGFSQQASLNTHVECIHKIILKEITCQYCGEIIRGRSKILRHMAKHTGRPVQCDICKKMYKTKSTLIQHLKHHSDFKPFQCGYCEMSFYTNNSLINHTHNIHRPVRLIYECDICGHKYSCSAAFKRHKLRHTENNVACIKCGRFYPNAEELAKHRKYHTKEKSVCPECDGTFCDDRSLQRHIERKHNPNLEKVKSVKLKSKSMVECKDEKIEIEILPLL